MRNQETQFQPPDRDITSEINVDNELSYSRLMNLLITEELDDRAVAATMVNYEKSAQNVRDRWELYKYAENYADIQAISLKAAAVPPNGSLLDIGTADGKYLYDIAMSYERPDVMLLGLELIEAQLNHSQYWQRVSHDIFTNIEEEPRIFAEMINGSATNLSMFREQSIDAVTAMFMMYHLPAKARVAALDECARVLKPDGRLVISTSGVYNKKLHRKHEKLIAEHMSGLVGGQINPPRQMNTDFVSESSTQELRNFKNVFGYEYHDKIILDGAEKFNAYEKSLRSMYDQFDPIPDIDVFNAAISVVMYKIERAAHMQQPPEEIIQRQVLVCSNGPISKNSLPAGFGRRYFKAKNEFKYPLQRAAE